MASMEKSQNFFAARPKILTVEAKDKYSPSKQFWKSFKHKQELKLSASLVSLSYSPRNTTDIAVGVATHLEVYQTKAVLELKQSYSKSKEVIYCSSYRSDGKLIATGNAIGEIMIYDVESKLLLRTLTGHRNAVRSIAFMPDKTHLVSASDDKSIRLWDVTEGKEVQSFVDHTDYVRSLSISSSSPNLFLSGSYDGYLHLYDCNANSRVLQINHQSPVEAVKLLSSGAMAVSVGGNVVKFWDLMAGGTLINSIECHQKTITCLVASPDGRFVITGSLDRQVKVVSLDSFEVVHSFEMNSTVLSLSLNSVCNQLCIGLANGSLWCRTRKAKIEEAYSSLRDIDAQSMPVDVVMQQKNQVEPATKTFNARHSPFDRHLKKFQYRSAFDCALQTLDRTHISMAIIELHHRNGLKVAIEGRNVEWLSGLLQYICKNIRHPESSSALTLLSNKLIDLYNHGAFTFSPETVRLFSILRNVIVDEAQVQNEVQTLCGSLATILACPNS